jgi:chromosome partitioning protein
VSLDTEYVWPPTWLSPKAHSWLPVDWLDQIQRVVALINGKGGVGKTTVSANVAGLAAANGQHALLIDANAQGNIARELGYRKSAIDDKGEAFYESIRRGRPLEPARDVRPGLDVVVGGSELEGLGSLLNSMVGVVGPAANLALARCLVPIAPDYDLIVIDSPPENAPVERLVLTTSRYLIVPTKSDDASLDGLGMVADRFTDAKALNPDLEILGVLLFATGRGSSAIRRDVAARVKAMLGDVAPLFDRVVGHAEKIAKEARTKGKLVFELEEHRLDRLRNPDDPNRRKTPIEELAEDYDGIYAQFCQLLAEHESTAA